MKLTNAVRALALCASVVFGFEANAGKIKTQSAVEPGKWTSDYYGGLDYAEKNNVPAFVFWANAGCGHCEKAETQMNEEPFLTWMAERKIVMIFTESDSKVKKWIKDHAKETIKDFPYAAVYWPENSKGEMVLEGFSAYKGKMSAYGANSKDSNAVQIMTAVDFLIPDWNPGGVKPVEPEPVEPEPVEHVHQWSAWTVTEAATCLAAGEQQRTCSAADCPKPVETQAIKALGHDWNEWTIVTPAGVGVEGQKRRACKRCGASETAVIPALDPEPERKEVNASVVYKGKKMLSGVVYEDDLVGTASVTLGKISKNGQVKVTLKMSRFVGGSASASATVAPNEFGDLAGTLNFKSSYGGAMDFEIVYNDGEFEFSAANEQYSVELGTVKIGGVLDTDELMFSAQMDDFELPYDYDFVVDAPVGEPVYVKNGTKFSFDKAPSVKYKMFKEDGWKWYELVGLDDEVKTNVNNLKLSYKSKGGAFSGSFKVYASNESSVDDGKKPKLKTYTVKVSGVVVGGVGYGTLKIGSKVVGSCSLE